jgi:hypothetical protein
MDWDNDAIKAAAAYFRDLIDAGSADERTHAVYAGLLDVLDPARSAMRIGQAVSADTAVALGRARLDRRSPIARRLGVDRRTFNVGSLNGDRRSHPRRILQDRRAAQQSVRR